MLMPTNTRRDYEHPELDLDGCIYWFTNSDVSSPWKNPKLKPFLDWWRSNEVNNGFYYKGTHLYFTFECVKYDVSWTFYDETYMKNAIKMLRQLGAENIQINYGEPD